jgi:hypothetical protein
MNIRAKTSAAGQKLLWFFSDPNRVIATFTVVLAIIGLGALHVASDTERRQLRAYMVLDSVSITRLEVGKTIEVEVIMKNTGQTPAYNISGYTAIMYDRFPLGRPFPPVENDNINTTISGSGGLVRGKVPTLHALTDETLAAFNAGTMATYVSGKITYIDAFGDHHFLKYRLYMTKLAESGGLFQPLDVEGNGGN